MTDPQHSTNYPVMIIRRADGYELRIRELLLSVRSSDLQQAYDRLIAKKQEVINWAIAAGTLDEVPPPRPLPPLRGPNFAAFLTLDR